MFSYKISVRLVDCLRSSTYSSHVGGQPYEAFQAQAKSDHTWFSWYFDNFNLDAAANAAVQMDVAIVFLLSDSGEGYVTVYGNPGDR
jgi:hypothetical protein